MVGTFPPTLGKGTCKPPPPWGYVSTKWLAGYPSRHGLIMSLALGKVLNGVLLLLP